MKLPRTAILVAVTLFAILASIPATVHSVTWSSPSTVPAPSGFHSDPSATQDLTQSNVWLFYSSLRVPAKSEIYYMKYNPAFQIWQSEIRVTTNTDDDASPAVTTLTNGTITLYWAAHRTGLPSWDIYNKRLTSGIWTPEARLTTSTLDDEKPAVLQDRQGRIFVAWNRNVTGNIDLFYNVYQNGIWLGETRLTSTVGEDRLASLAQTKDGRIWIVWTARGNQAVSFIEYATYNGVSWSAPTILAQSGDGDLDPSIIQDREGTIWVVWTRNIKVGNSYQGDMYYMTSVDNGATWSAPTPFASTDTLDELQPSIKQFDDHRLWIFYSLLDENTSVFSLQFINSSPIQNVHDVRMDSLTASSPSAPVGGTVTLTTTFTNLGDFLETARIIIKANNTLLVNTTSTVRVGETISLPFTWNTAGFNPGPYLLTATITVTGETVGNSKDNTATTNVQLLVILPGAGGIPKRY